MQILHGRYALVSEIMNKLNYLAKTFSRTNRKDYENYCINRIWSQLNRTDIKPVTQSYIPLSDGRGAFLDLHFPSINYAIEIDEPYHHNVNQHRQDLSRTEQIIKATQNINYDAIEIDRITITQDINELHRQIDHIVERIETKIAYIPTYKWYDANPIVYIQHLQSQGVITTSDNVHLPTIQHIRQLFYDDRAETKRSTQTGFSLPLQQDTIIWCLKPSGKQIISDDGMTIEDKTQYVKDMDAPHIVFVKIKDPLTNDNQYVFIGVFHYNEYDNKFHRSATRINLDSFNPYL